MLTKRNTKEEMLRHIDDQERLIDRLRQSKKSYVKTYEYQKTVIEKAKNYNQFLLVENHVHMQGKIRLQDELYERDLLIYSLMNN